MNRTIFILLVAFMFGSCSKPIADFMLKQESKEAPSKITFVNNSQNADSYTWDMGDGTMIEGELTEHKYALSGKYEVKLIAKKGGKTNIKTQEVVVNPPKECLIEIETSEGNMLVKLYDETPKHRDNFVKLVDQKFYDNLLFHRVIEGFMIQGGDPKSKNASTDTPLGSGGPGYQIDAEFNPKLYHKKGALAAARTGGPGNPEKRSSGSQFYIVQGSPLSDSKLDNLERRLGIEFTEEIRETYNNIGGTPQLDREYTVFGEVIKGLEVIDKIAATATKPGDRPIEDKWMKIRIIK